LKFDDCGPVYDPTVPITHGDPEGAAATPEEAGAPADEVVAGALADLPDEPHPLNNNTTVAEHPTTALNRPFDLIIPPRYSYPQVAALPYSDRTSSNKSFDYPTIFSSR
jgi:hypothetical protein